MIRFRKNDVTCVNMLRFNRASFFLFLLMRSFSRTLHDKLTRQLLYLYAPKYADMELCVFNLDLLILVS
jgi:hypothetical protein